MLITTGEVDTLAEMLSSIQKGWCLNITRVGRNGRRASADVIFQEVRGAAMKVVFGTPDDGPEPEVDPYWIDFEDIVAIHVY